MASLTLPRFLVDKSVLGDTFAQLRLCGENRRECVVYWLGPTDPLEVVDEIVHPMHSSGVGGYEVDDGWLTRFWFELARRRKSIKVQVHTHPRLAGHSPVDDEYAVVHTPGFLSLVIPNFARGPVRLEGAFLAERMEDGRWRAAAIAKHLGVVP